MKFTDIPKRPEDLIEMYKAPFGSIWQDGARFSIVTKEGTLEKNYEDAEVSNILIEPLLEAIMNQIEDN